LPSVWIQRILVTGDSFSWMAPPILDAISHLPIISVVSTAFLKFLRQGDYRALIQNVNGPGSRFLFSIFCDLRRRAADGWLRLSGSELLNVLDAVLSSQTQAVLPLALPIVELLSAHGVVGDLDAISHHKLAVFVLRFYNNVWSRKTENPGLAKMAVSLITAVASSQECCTAMVRAPEFAAVLQSASDADPILVHVNWQFFARVARFPDVLVEILKDKAMGKELTTAIQSKDAIVLRRFLELSIEIFSKGRQDVVEAYCLAMRTAERLPRVAILYKQRRREWKDNKGMMALIENYAKAAMARVAPGVQEFLEDFKRHMGGDTDVRGRGKVTVRKALSQLLEEPGFGV
jgi:hypothetical protein